MRACVYLYIALSEQVVELHLIELIRALKVEPSRDLNRKLVVPQGAHNVRDQGLLCTGNKHNKASITQARGTRKTSVGSHVTCQA